MEWDELKPLLDRLEDTATPREVIGLIKKAKKAAHFDGGFSAYIRIIIAKDLGVQPKLNVVPPKKRTLLDPFLDIAYEYGLKGAFDHRDNPDLFMEYCSPFSDKRGKYLDEMSDKQKHVFSMMDKDIMVFKRKGKQEPNTIEDALNDTIRKRINETSKDTSE
jgi:hypothetical protein